MGSTTWKVGGVTGSAQGASPEGVVQKGLLGQRASELSPEFQGNPARLSSEGEAFRQRAQQGGGPAVGTRKFQAFPLFSGNTRHWRDQCCKTEQNVNNPVILNISVATVVK